MENLVVEHQQGMAILTINRPQRLNALTQTMMDGLLSLCRQIEQKRDIHALIITGAGRAFCAGGDIDAWSARTPEGFSRHWLRDGHQAFDALARLRQPVVAVLNGHALGGGLELAACADYRIAEAHVRLGLPEPTLGMVPGWSGTQRTVRRFGSQLVRRMGLFGEQFSAEQAVQVGLVDRVVDEGEGLASAKTLVQGLRHRGPVALELVKMMINAAEGEERERIVEVLAGRLAAAHPELEQGLAAFKARTRTDFWNTAEG